MHVERGHAPHAGVYLPTELSLLRGVVRDTLHAYKADLDNDDADVIAQEVVAAYRRGVLDRDELLQIALMVAKRRAIEHYYEMLPGLFA